MSVALGVIGVMAEPVTLVRFEMEPTVTVLLMVSVWDAEVSPDDAAVIDGVPALESP